MTPADLDILIQQGEGTTLEFKESLSSSFAREVVALANTIGGKIILGVRDGGSRWMGCSRSTSGKATPSLCSAATAFSGVRAR